jgi:hypothetical protein
MNRPAPLPKTQQQLNDSLVDFLDQLCNSGLHGFINGDAYDTWFSESLRDHLNASLVTTQEFDGTNNRSRDPSKMNYAEYKRQCASRVFDFRAIDAARKANGLPILGEGTYIIDKPNGQQAWPDMLLVHNGVGLPIEMKSAKTQKPVWNSGLPVHHGLYVFTHNKKKTKNQPKKSETVFYFGEQVIDEFEIFALKAIEDVTSLFNIKIKSPTQDEERWKYYARAMNNHLVNFFKGANTQQLSTILTDGQR